MPSSKRLQQTLSPNRLWQNLAPVNALALRASFPVLSGYLPLGATFGVLFSDLGYHWLYATAMGLFIFAGAGQFLAVGLLASQASLLEMALATLLLNSRHIFYGLSVLPNMRSRGWRRWYQVFGLTDETYSLVTSTHLPEGVDRMQFQVRVTALNHLYWIMGCSLGAWLGSTLSFNSDGIAFVLPALFVVLCIEQYKHVSDLKPFIVAGLIGLGTLLWISREHMLLIALALCVALLLTHYAISNHGLSTHMKKHTKAGASRHD